MIAILRATLIIFSAISFLSYGLACFFSSYMEREFVRYRFASQRAIIGGFQLCAAIGLLVGLSQPWMGRAASAGLTVMMLVAIGVRVRIKDTFWQMTPAIFYLLLNAYLCLSAF